VQDLFTAAVRECHSCSYPCSRARSYPSSHTRSSCCQAHTACCRAHSSCCRGRYPSSRTRSACRWAPTACCRAHTACRRARIPPADTAAIPPAAGEDAPQRRWMCEDAAVVLPPVQQRNADAVLDMTREKGGLDRLVSREHPADAHFPSCHCPGGSPAGPGSPGGAPLLGSQKGVSE
jgi:hypothetical protein